MEPVAWCTTFSGRFTRARVESQGIKTMLAFLLLKKSVTIKRLRTIKTFYRWFFGSNIQRTKLNSLVACSLFHIFDPVWLLGKFMMKPSIGNKVRHCGRSRSGKLLLAPLELWKNRVITLVDTHLKSLSVFHVNCLSSVSRYIFSPRLSMYALSTSSRKKRFCFKWGSRSDM